MARWLGSSAVLTVVLLAIIALIAALAVPRGTPSRPGAQAPAAPKAPATPEAPESAGEATRADLIVGLNDLRAKAEVSPLAPDAALDRMASQLAAEIARRGSLSDERASVDSLGSMQRRLAAAGYQAHGWAESIVATDGDAAAVLDYWRQGSQFAEAMRSDYQDLGVGIARLGRTPLYVFLVAWPERQYFAREVADLSDLAAVRREMLAEVNRLRLQAGRSPLSEEPRLDEAAQEHAEDMLLRVYYDHRSPEGKDVGDRLHASGYAWRLAGENLAAGHTSVRSVVAAWMRSTDHRRNMLHPGFVHFGAGLAVGAYDHRYKVLWVQTFGTPE
ncbi:MAG TPA: CAP domain-containing protein [Thermoanaerobaculia bacterium]|nr:CAP domain-containing protein [Thermoanaerobaculia bacterium]